MSLDVRLLEKVRELASGIVQARCPACAEGGGDRAGEHLRLYPDGRFGCCVHPKEREHRKRIFALAGDKSPRSFTVKAVRVHPAVEPARSVTASLTSFVGTPGTAISESVWTETGSQDEFGTLGTPVLMSRAHGREEEQVMCDDMHTCKDFQSGVPSVPSAAKQGMPYLTAGGVLGIPFDSPERFHWWKGGQSIAETRAEVEAWMREDARKEHDVTSV